MRSRSGVSAWDLVEEVNASRERRRHRVRRHQPILGLSFWPAFLPVGHDESGGVRLLSEKAGYADY